MEENKIYYGDCMELMKQIDDKSVDMILCDLPYGITACEWDSIIPLEPLWKEYKRIIKEDGVIVLTASQPFTTDLINSNKGWFKYELIWDKIKGSNILMASKMPLKSHENILVFYNSQPIYNPQKLKGFANYDKSKYKKSSKTFGFDNKETNDICKDGSRYPTSILRFSKNWQPQKSLHSTQKPVELFEYLIRTYSNEGDLVLDNCIGSGTTAVACKQTNRRFIGIDNNQEYVNMANKRLNFTTVGDFNLPTEESLISVKRESADSPNSPHDSSTIKEEANFS